MNKDRKLREARYFLDRLTVAAADDSEGLPFLVSAFLSAARSVLQYALREMGGTSVIECRACGEPLACADCGQPQTRAARSPGIAWYEQRVGSRDVLRFMKATRDFEIHERPARIRTDAIIEVAGRTLRVGSSDSEGRVVVTSVGGMPFTQRPSHHFAGWPGGETVEELCAQYLSEVEALVADARAKGFLAAVPGKGA